MDKVSRIDGREYSLIEQLPALAGEAGYVICEDAEGKRFVCPEELWLENVPQTEQAAPICTHSSTQEKIECFLSMFRGREELYARRYYSTKTGKSGYTPVCKNEWVQGLCDKRRYKCADCPNRAFVSLNYEAVKAHLRGNDPLCRDVAAIYPMCEDNTTWLLAADFDEANWQADVAAFRKCCTVLGLTPAVERSRSGNGAHVWIFFSEPVSAADARRLGSGLLTWTIACRHELSFASYDRLFPTQDTVPKGGFGNLIALPFQGQAQKAGNTLFVDEQFVPYPDQWAFLSTLPKVTPEQLTGLLTTLCQDGDVGALAETAEKPVPWQRKRAQRLDRSDFPLQVTLTLSNLIYLDKAGFSQAALNMLKRLAAFPNPEFRAKQAMRLPVYGTPRILDCGYEDDAYIGLPRGCQDTLMELLEQYNVPIATEDKRCNGKAIDVAFNGTLRSEQEPAAQALLVEDMGVLSATTAFGKTVIGAYLIGQRKVNTLVLVHSSALLEQWRASLEQFLTIHEVLPEPPKKRGRKKRRCLIGRVGAGKDTRGGIIDIAIMQSLFEGEEKEVKSFVEDYGMVIVDECHHVAALQAIPASEEVVVVATGKYIGEGFDAPRLDTLFLAMPISWRGTLAQYAGRLHRNYEGKHEVRIYDYVDVHIPMLERMYHKRLKGYAELGYQVKFGTSDEPVSMIYDGHNAMAPFEQDLSDAAQSIVIVSPYLQKGRVGRLLPLLQSTVSRGVEITVHTNDDDARRSEIAAAVDALQSAGAEVILHKDLQQRYAVLDERIVWYGNVDLLAFGRRDTDVLRFENADIAGELLSLTGEKECEQLMITD